MSDTPSCEHICRLTNDMFRDTPDIRTIARTLDMTLEEVWECIGVKDYFDFEETGNKDWFDFMEVGED